jgi:hypothetical protein
MSSKRLAALLLLVTLTSGCGHFGFLCNLNNNFCKKEKPAPPTPPKEAPSPK